MEEKTINCYTHICKIWELKGVPNNTLTLDFMVAVEKTLNVQKPTYFRTIVAMGGVNVVKRMIQYNEKVNQKFKDKFDWSQEGF